MPVPRKGPFHNEWGNFAFEAWHECNRLADVLFPHGDAARMIVIEEKAENDFVTEKDKAVDQWMTEFLTKQFGYPVISEERAHVWPPEENRAWIIDPIDGTHNLSRRWTDFGIMLVLLENGIPRFSILFFPFAYGMRREMIFGGPDIGTWVMDDARSCRSLSVNHRAPLERSFVFLEGPVKRMVPEMARLIPAIGGCRVCMSCAVSFAGLVKNFGGGWPVAGVVALNNKPWDNLPGYPIVVGAGGIMTGVDGKQISVHNCTDAIAANNRENHKKLLALVNSVRPVSSRTPYEAGDHPFGMVFTK